MVEGINATIDPTNQMVVILLEDLQQNVTQQDQTVSYFLSEEVATILQMLFLVRICSVTSITDIVANTINTAVFVKQGAYKEFGSVNLLGLAISDMCVVTTTLYTSMSYLLVYIDPPNTSWNLFDVFYLTGGWPRWMCAQITRLITAYVAFERCICVVLPFKVKTMLTPKRSGIIIISIFVCVIISCIPTFVSYRLRFVFDPVRNTSRLVLVLTQSSDITKASDILCYINGVVFNLGSVAIVFMCNVVTVARVNSSIAWRDSMATGSRSTEDTVSSNRLNSETCNSSNIKALTPKENIDPKTNSKMQKEKKLVIVIVMISVIFLICYLPDLSFMIMYSINEEISSYGKYKRLAVVMHSVSFFMETFGSSINIVVYYRMSSKYKQTCRQLLGLSTE